jgi:hypothetical protein
MEELLAYDSERMPFRLGFGILEITTQPLEGGGMGRGGRIY